MPGSRSATALPRELSSLLALRGWQTEASTPLQATEMALELGEQLCHGKSLRSLLVADEPYTLLRVKRNALEIFKDETWRRLRIGGSSMVLK